VTQNPEQFVEGDVAVSADAEQQQVDAAARRNQRLIARRFGGDVAGHAVWNSRPPGIHVDMSEQILLHISMKASRQLRCDADKFIEVEARRRPE
jgi:hypothetical protein